MHVWKRLGDLLFVEIGKLDEVVSSHVKGLVVVKSVSKSLDDGVEVSDVLELESVLLLISLNTKVVLIAVRFAQVCINRLDLAEVDLVVGVGLTSVLVEADDILV